MCSAVGSTFVLKNKGAEDICLDPPKNKLSWVNTTYICNSRIRQAYFLQKLTQIFKELQMNFTKTLCTQQLFYQGPSSEIVK